MTLFNKISTLALAIAVVGATVISAPAKAQAEEWGPSQVTAYSSEGYPGYVAWWAIRSTTTQLLNQGGLYVAANGVPFGTKLCAYGVGYLGEVVDRIGHSSDVDLLYRTDAEAYAWGRRTLRVYTCN
jgi:3D (Asp-Asp-Asp) domain-containing protein